jgi:hypothetical protein
MLHVHFAKCLRRLPFTDLNGTNTMIEHARPSVAWLTWNHFPDQPQARKKYIFTPPPSLFPSLFSCSPSSTFATFPTLATYLLLPCSTSSSRLPSPTFVILLLLHPWSLHLLFHLCLFPSSLLSLLTLHTFVLPSFNATCFSCFTTSFNNNNNLLLLLKVGDLGFCACFAGD